MTSASAETIIISLGGSLMVPDGVDLDFLERFKALIATHSEAGTSFVIVTGGGRLARDYRDALQTLRPDAPTDDLDWVGIHATRLNGELLLRVFGKVAYQQLITDPTDIPRHNKQVTIAAGWKPGWSTDYVAVTAAATTGASQVVNLTNIDYVYDADPKQNPEAEPQEQVSWEAYRSIIGDTWMPGMNTPFDPVASAKAQELGVEVAIINGAHLERLDHYFSGESFTGTRLGPQ